jgi:Ni/Co efflux regulator RcnB
MKTLMKTVVSSLLLLGIAAAPAMADDHGRGHDRSNDRKGYSSQRDYRSNNNGYRNDYRYARPQAYYVQPRPYYYAPRVVMQRPVPYWVRGGHYYGQNYAPTYIVNDWGYYGLNQPPPGYYWRRSDAGDFLLVALATGIIADLILNH